VPQVLEVSLLDDTPAANAETRAWLQELVAETPAPVAEGQPAAEAPVVENFSAPGWHRKFADSFDLATAAMKAGQPEKAIDTMTRKWVGSLLVEANSSANFNWWKSALRRGNRRGPAHH